MDPLQLERLASRLTSPEAAARQGQDLFSALRIEVPFHEHLRQAASTIEPPLAQSSPAATPPLADKSSEQGQPASTEEPRQSSANDEDAAEPAEATDPDVVLAAQTPVTEKSETALPDAESSALTAESAPDLGDDRPRVPTNEEAATTAQSAEGDAAKQPVASTSSDSQPVEHTKQPAALDQANTQGVAEPVDQLPAEQPLVKQGSGQEQAVPEEHIPQTANKPVAGATTANEQVAATQAGEEATVLEETTATGSSDASKTEEGLPEENASRETRRYSKRQEGAQYRDADQPASSQARPNAAASLKPTETTVAVAPETTATLEAPSSGTPTTTAATVTVAATSAAVTASAVRSTAEVVTNNASGNYLNSTDTVEAVSATKTTESTSAKTAAATEQTSGTQTLDRVRLVQRVARAVESAQLRGGTIRMRIHPPELGSLRVEVEVRGGNLTARIEAETTAARTALVENLPALRERLAEQNIRVERFEVYLQGETGESAAQNFADNQHGERYFSNSQSRNNRRNAPNQEQTNAVASVTTSDTAPTDGQLNVVI